MSNYVLIGMRGTGKSNLSRRLSVRTKRQVLATDLLIQYENGGRAISDIVADGDWRQFREMEFQVIQKVAAMDGVIIDCGGGVVVDLDENDREVYSTRKVETLKSNGILVWLKGDIPRLAAKVAHDERRPVLDRSQPEEKVMKRREPFYERAADIIIDIEGRRRKALVKDLHWELINFSLPQYT